MKVRIYRSILLNENEEINPQFGKAWTLDETFAHNHAEEINKVRGKDGYVILMADVDSSDIDQANTLFAMEDRPHEFEVICNPISVKAQVWHTEIDSIEDGSFISGEIEGRDFADYNDTYEGDIPWADFLALADEF